MIETDKQRRWWFATHPEYSRGGKGAAKRGHSGRNRGTSPPAAADRGGDLAETLRNAPDKIVNLFNRFTRGMHESAETSPRSRWPDSPPPPLRERLRLAEEGLRRARDRGQLEQDRVSGEDRRGIESDPHTALDVMPYRRLLTAPVQTIKGILWGKARGTVVNATRRRGTHPRWKVGDDHYNVTSMGREPAWSTVRTRYWKNQATLEAMEKKWGAENLERMRRGLAPRRTNPRTGKLESMELHHPVPRKEGGKEFVELWPDEHAKVDRYRRTKNSCP